VFDRSRSLLPSCSFSHLALARFSASGKVNTLSRVFSIADGMSPELNLPSRATPRCPTANHRHALISHCGAQFMGSRRAPRHDAVRRPDSRTARCDSVRRCGSEKYGDSLKPRYSAILCVFRTQTAFLRLRMRLVNVHRRGRQDPHIAAGSLRMPRNVLAPACFVSGSIHKFNLRIVTISGGYYDE
jgi:hypothetical protein